MPTDADDTLLPFSLPSIGQKKITAAFDGGEVSSDGGVLLLAGADKRLGLINRLADSIPDPRNPALITHTMADLLRARVLAIACGYPDADDLGPSPPRPGIQAGLWAATRHRPAPRLAANPVAVREHARSANADPPHLRDDRSVV